MTAKPDGDPLGEDANQIRLLADEADRAGLLEAGQQEIEILVGESLYSDVLAASEKNLPIAEWASGDYGPANLFERFIKYEARAIRAQICLEDGTGLKPQYAKLIKANAPKASSLVGISGAIMATYHASVETVIGPATAIYLALWLMHTNLDLWCTCGGSSK